MNLPERITKYVAQCESAIAGQHGHDQTFAVACKLIWGFGLSVEQAWSFILEYNLRCIPQWSERHLRRKLEQALAHRGHTKPRGYLLGQLGQQINCLPPVRPIPKPEPTWNEPDLSAIAEIVSSGPNVFDLWERSPVWWEDNDSHVEEIIDILFPGNPLLCVGKSTYQFATRRRETWRGHLAGLPLMVPNPMLAIKGQTQDGRQSEHTKSATARRVYQVIEFDFAELDKNGRETLWTPLIRKWRDSGNRNRRCLRELNPSSTWAIAHASLRLSFGR